MVNRLLQPFRINRKFSDDFNRLFNTDKIRQQKFSLCLCLEIMSASIYYLRKSGLVERGSRINLRRAISCNLKSQFKISLLNNIAMSFIKPRSRRLGGFLLCLRFITAQPQACAVMSCLRFIYFFFSFVGDYIQPPRMMFRG